MQIKLFSATSIKAMESQVNEFLKENEKNLKKIQITHTESESYYTVMIVYETYIQV